MTGFLFIILGIGLFCWWLSGNWYAWAAAFVAIALPAFIGLYTNADGGNGFVKGAVFVAVWWMLTGIPHYLRRRRERFVVISPWSS